MAVFKLFLILKPIILFLLALAINKLFWLTCLVFLALDILIRLILINISLRIRLFTLVQILIAIV
jgi:hypothetical protein